MKCENCQNEHDGSFATGRFCSVKCSRSFSAKTNIEETNKKRSETLKRKYASGEISKSLLSHSFKPGFDIKRRKFSIEDRKKAVNAIKKRWEIHIQNSPFEDLSKNIKKRLVFEEQEKKCIICNTPNWMNKPLKFHLDHIDGNHFNNVRKNLRVLCPNCHSQTETYCKNTNKRYTDDEIIHTVESSKSINAALGKLKMSNGANYKRIQKLVVERGVEPLKF